MRTRGQHEEAEKLYEEAESLLTCCRTWKNMLKNICICIKWINVI